mmetsp:Transcript_38375/g.88553  ORF Transcript_38375/g.88553 Transcript_38375/m.88553 type:complete len:290 (+) Transcript_38375:377-1246(+)
MVAELQLRRGSARQHLVSILVCDGPFNLVVIGTRAHGHSVALAAVIHVELGRTNRAALQSADVGRSGAVGLLPRPVRAVPSVAVRVGHGKGEHRVHRRRRHLRESRAQCRRHVVALAPDAVAAVEIFQQVSVVVALAIDRAVDIPVIARLREARTRAGGGGRRRGRSRAQRTRHRGQGGRRGGLGRDKTTDLSRRGGAAARLLRAGNGMLDNPRDLRVPAARSHLEAVTEAIGPPSAKVGHALGAIFESAGLEHRAIISRPGPVGTVPSVAVRVIHLQHVADVGGDRWG